MLSGKCWDETHIHCLRFNSTPINDCLTKFTSQVQKFGFNLTLIYYIHANINQRIFFFIYISLQGRSSICNPHSSWGRHYLTEEQERRSSAPPPLNANLLRVRRFSYAFDLDNNINSRACACHNYARGCFGFCRRSRRFSEQVNWLWHLKTLLLYGIGRNIKRQRIHK